MNMDKTRNDKAKEREALNYCVYDRHNRHHASYSVKLDTANCSPATMARLTADRVGPGSFVCVQHDDGTEDKVYEVRS